MANTPLDGGGLMGAVQAQLDQLSPRDRKLLAGMVIVFAVIFVGFVALSLRGTLNDAASRVVTKKESLAAIQDLQGEYIKAAGRIEAAETRLREYGDQSVAAYLEKVASEVGVREELSVNKQTSETVGNLQQTRYKVDLRRVPYDLSLNFIYDIETGGYPLSMESARLKAVTYKGEKMVNVQLELVVYSLEEEQG